MESSVTGANWAARTVAAAGLATLPHVFAAGSDRIHVGLVGCGARGTGAEKRAAGSPARRHVQL